MDAIQQFITSGDLSGALGSSLLFAYLAVFIAGVLTSFTPCVYPVIPLTASYVGAASSGGSRWRSLSLSSFYVLGMALVYACLGMFAALTGSLFGSIGSSPWTYLIVGNLVLCFGLVMLDVISIPTPAFLGKLDNLSPRSQGFLPALGMGAISGLVIGPCTAPVLGAVLAYVGTKQSLFLGFTLLFTFALGMGTLLILIGSFAGLLASLPRSGEWMNWVKKGFGFVMLLVAEYFFFQAGQLYV